MVNPYQLVKDFEDALCQYTGAHYAVAVTSCTMALLLACKYIVKPDQKTIFTVPRKTYVSVPQSIIHAGGRPIFSNEIWAGFYQLYPWRVYDSARYFTSDLFNIVTDTYSNRSKAYVCCSFHWSKTLAIGQGGAILHNDPEADEWFRRMRFDGRTEGVAPVDDKFDALGYHCYMSPRDAAEGLSRLAVLPKHNAPLPNDNYPDLSKMEIFK